jgi:hypothetical protein
MKKTIALSILSLFILSAITTTLAQPTTQPTHNLGTTDFTHTVFAEDGTATWCGYCHYAREALDTIYTSHDYPFYYVCLVCDVDTHSADRFDEFQPYGYPTVWFDGGYNTQIGGYTGNEQDYRQVIPDCGNQPVADIDINLQTTWSDPATIGISVGVQNNEAATYAGHIHVYVCEIESSMGWHDTSGHPYTMAFLDYAANEDISINSGDTWTNAVSWVGADHNDGYGHNFGSIQKGNIEVIAVVFNNTWHQGYSYPPSGYPFDAYYVDDAAGQQVGNTNLPPAQPSEPNPSDGATYVSIDKDLSWTCSDPNEDTLSYDVYLGTTNPPTLAAQNIAESQFDPGTMIYNATYYWQIVAKDPFGLTNESPIWSFTTGSNPDSQPPTITMVKPLAHRLYLFNILRMPLLTNKTVIIGALTIKADVTDAMTGVQKVEFYIDGGLQATRTSEPYTYDWSQSFGFAPTSHTIKIVAFDKAGNSATAIIPVTKRM